MVDQIFYPNPVQVPSQQTQQTQQKARSASGNKVTTPFARVLEEKLPAQDVKFSQHAKERLQARGINLSQNDLQKLGNAVDSVARKGGRESLVMMGDNAFVVSVKNRTVITALDKQTMQGNVFTNIDSAVVM